LGFLKRFAYKSPISNFTDWLSGISTDNVWTDKWMEMRKLIGSFCNQVNVPKYWSFIHVGLEGMDAVSKHGYICFRWNAVGTITTQIGEMSFTMIHSHCPAAHGLMK
jgi:hypothetical protein